MALVLAGHRAPQRSGPRGRTWLVASAAVSFVALGVRLAIVLGDGGLSGLFGYDSGVYFAGADALIHGRMPYRDFILLHPPTLMCALTPFAALTAVLTDSQAFTVALLSFCALGAINAGLVVHVARRLALPLPAAACGGLFYALWFGAAGSEYLIRLETLGNTLLLLALVAVLRARRTGRIGSAAAAGVLIGLAGSVKIWCVVPAALLLVWFVRPGCGRHRGLAATGGALGALAAVNLPFFVAAPGAMWSSVVSAQLGRASSEVGAWERLADLSTLPRVVSDLSPDATRYLGAAFVVAMAVVCRRAWRAGSHGRAAVQLLAAQAAVLLLAPSWFGQYSSYLAVAAALTVALAASSPPRRRRVGSVAALTVFVAAVTVTSFALGDSFVRPWRGARTLSAAVAHTHCLMADSPIAQIRLNTLTRDLRAGCPNWIDVTGLTYGPDRADVPRRDNERWQRDLRDYLLSGDAFVLVRPAGTQPSDVTWQQLRRGGELARSHGHVVYRTPK